MSGHLFTKVAKGLAIGVTGLVAGMLLAEGGLPKPSTRRLWREARAAGQPWWRFAHTYAYARWPNGFIGSAIGERLELLILRPLFAPFLRKLALQPHRWADGYHGKTLPTPSARRLVQVREEVHMTVPEQVIPFESARHLILSQPDHIVALDCPCRIARKKPCLPLDVCLIVGEPFASFVLEHHPYRARPINSEEAVQILEAEAERGHAHLAFFKEAMLDRFYAICNCCACCCGAIGAQRSGVPMVISSGYVAQVDEASCRACGTCAERCPFAAIQVASVAQVDAAACMGCGVCVRACPAEALALVRDESKPAPLELPA